ncbi:MAG TPA: helix-turn-helix transcriptional regulator [Pseudonocardiaceae bacterium]|nr:helix-turn-helix transcriptional regulator [Pseudonocardiaceae bacterium]
MARLPLTDREDEVRRLAIGGLSNDQIAARLAISRRTVEAHMRTLFRKTGVTRRSELSVLDHATDTVPEPSAPEHRWLQQLRRYARAVHGLVDRQFPLFEERVEITLLVAEQDGQDLVVERRWTRPRPYLVYRILGPILTWPPASPIEPEHLELACNVNGQDTQVDIHLVSDVDGRLLAMILFQPGLQHETEWVLRYRSPTLWNPLRSAGRESLSWATATFDQRHPATTSELTLKVVFPASWTAQRLTEKGDLGTVRTERLPTGQTQFIWHHDTPHAGAYHWLLEGTRP